MGGGWLGGVVWLLESSTWSSNVFLALNVRHFYRLKGYLEGHNVKKAIIIDVTDLGSFCNLDIIIGHSFNLIVLKLNSVTTQGVF